MEQDPQMGFHYGALIAEIVYYIHFADWRPERTSAVGVWMCADFLS